MPFTPRDGQTLHPSPMVEMFGLDLNPIGVAQVYRFYGGEWEGPRDLYFPVLDRQILAKLTVRGLSAVYAGGLDEGGTAQGSLQAARFQSPSGCAVGPDGAIYVSGVAGGNVISRIDPVAGQVATIAGGTSGYQDGPLAQARFAAPSGLAVADDGNLYVADSSNHVIRQIRAGIVSTLAGTAGAVGGDDGTGAAARFQNPKSIALDADGNLYVADEGAKTIRRVTPDGVVTTLAGLHGTTGTADGTGSAARFGRPYGIAMAADGHLYVTDSDNKTIRKVTLAGVVTTIAGSNGVSIVDGTGSAARFENPLQIQAGHFGELYVMDTFGPVFRRVTTAGVVTTEAAFVEGFSAAPPAYMVWKGEDYQPWPIQAEGFEVTNAGTIPRPKVRISTLGSAVNIGALVRQYQDLVGATITRRRTLRKYLDAINFSGGNPNADPLWEKVDVYNIAQKTDESPQEGIIEWELRAAWDMDGKLIPKRIIQAAACNWKDADTDVCAFVATCDRRLTTCKENHPSGALPYGGFAGSSLVSL